MISGCSSGGDGDYSASIPSTPVAAAKKPAVGPAITDKLKFDQLALDSPVKRITKGGVGYLEFKYTALDGTIRTCELPEAQSKGECLPGDWISTFDIYKKAETVVVKKREVKKTDQGVVDFPFVSPKPVRVAPDTQSSSDNDLAPAPMQPSNGTGLAP